MAEETIYKPQKIIALTTIDAIIDAMYFPVATTSGTYKIDWASLKKAIDILPAYIKVGDTDDIGQYEFWSHNIPGSEDNIITFRNIKLAKVHSIIEVRSPDAAVGGQGEATFSSHAVVGDGDFVHDVSLHNYAGTFKVADVLSNFGSSGELDGWGWYRKLYSESDAVWMMFLDANTGKLKTAGGYQSSDGTDGLTTSLTVTTPNGNVTLTFKNGLLTSAA